MTTLPTQKTYFQLHPLVSLPELKQWIQSPTGKERLDSLPEGAVRIEQLGHGFNLSVSDQWHHTFHTPHPKETLSQLVKCLREAEANYLVYRIPIGAPGWKPSPAFVKRGKGHNKPPPSDSEIEDKYQARAELAEYRLEIAREIRGEKLDDSER